MAAGHGHRAPQQPVAAPNALNGATVKLDESMAVDAEQADVWGRLLMLEPERHACGRGAAQPACGAHAEQPFVTPRAASDLHSLLKTSPFVVGRSHAKCNLVVGAATVSSAHFSLQWDSAGACGTITDLSSNGTWIDGVRMPAKRPIAISPGARITLVDSAERNIAVPSFLLHASTYCARGMSGGAADAPAGMASAGAGGADESAAADLGPRYRLGPELGRGAFAVVHAALDTARNMAVAVKIVTRVRGVQLHGRRRRTSACTSALAEVNILRTLTHRHVIEVLDCIETDARLYIVLERARGGDVRELVRAQPDSRLPAPLARTIFLQVLSGVAYLHSQGIVHRDIKPSNVLVMYVVSVGECTARLQANPREASTVRAIHVKLSDFGLARVVASDQFMVTICGTRTYLAPEVLALATGEQQAGARAVAGYSNRVDVWALGVMLYWMLAGALPFGSSNNEHVANVAAGNFSRLHWPATVPVRARALLTALLEPDPLLRPMAEGLSVAHAWLVTQGSGASQQSLVVDTPSLEVDSPDAPAQPAAQVALFALGPALLAYVLARLELPALACFAQTCRAARALVYESAPLWRAQASRLMHRLACMVADESWLTHARRVLFAAGSGSGELRERARALVRLLATAPGARPCEREIALQLTALPPDEQAPIGASLCGGTGVAAQGLCIADVPSDWVASALFGVSTLSPHEPMVLVLQLNLALVAAQACVFAGPMLPSSGMLWLLADRSMRAWEAVLCYAVGPGAGVAAGSLRRVTSSMFADPTATATAATTAAGAAPAGAAGAEGNWRVVRARIEQASASAGAAPALRVTRSGAGSHAGLYCGLAAATRSRGSMQLHIVTAIERFAAPVPGVVQRSTSRLWSAQPSMGVDDSQSSAVSVTGHVPRGAVLLPGSSSASPWLEILHWPVAGAGSVVVSVLQGEVPAPTVLRIAVRPTS